MCISTAMNSSGGLTKRAPGPLRVPILALPPPIHPFYISMVRLQF